MGLHERESTAPERIGEGMGSTQSSRQAGGYKGLHFRSGQCAMNGSAEPANLDGVCGAQYRIVHGGVMELEAAPARHSRTETHSL
jgi:hypothetical protein